MSQEESTKQTNLNPSAKPFTPNVNAKPFVPSFLKKTQPAETTKTAVIEEEEKKQSEEATTATADASQKVEKSGQKVPSEVKSNETAPADLEEKKYKFDSREHLNIVFIGHVDAGKSTLCGQIRYLAGQIDQRVLEKLQKDAKEKNRESWVYAYIMDLCDEEREKGKTIEVSTAKFETINKRYTILDAPGHEHYVNNMITGASQADVAVLVISAKKNEFEKGFEKGGQTREHATLAKTLGVKELVVAINKMDDPSVKWDIGRYEEIVKKLKVFFKQSGYKVEKEVNFLPISAQAGLNLTTRLKPEMCSWYNGKCLVEVLDGLEPVERNINGPLRVPIIDKFKDKKGGTCLLGKVESGQIGVGEKVVLMPHKVEGEVIGLKLHGNEDSEEIVEAVKAGDNAIIVVKGIEETDVTLGYVLCDAKHPLVPKVKEFLGQFAVLDKNIFSAGFSAVMHIHSAIEPITVTSLLKKLDRKTGKESDKKPNFGKAGDVITAKFECEKPICIEKFSVLPQLGRFTIREKSTIFVGKVMAIKPFN